MQSLIMHRTTCPSSETPVTHRATCPLCFGQLERVIVGGDPGEHSEFKFCRFCGTLFGPPWPEHQWSESSSEPVAFYVLDIERDRQVAVGSL